MKGLCFLVLVLVATAAWSQGGRERGYGPRWQPSTGAAAAPAGGMSAQERQRLREELKAARHGGEQPGWRGPMRESRKAVPAPMPVEERDRLRRDIHDANRELQGRR